MDILQIIILMFHITHICSKSRRRKQSESSSDETIENLLYYQDCQKNPKTTTSTPVPVQQKIRLMATMPTPPPQPECRFPKMCCALSCGNDCGSNQSPFQDARQGSPMIERQNLEPLQSMFQPGMLPAALRRRKKMKFSAKPMQLPLQTRRSFGFTKEKIKSILSQDADIKKILKNLVKVTMEKVDLMDLVNSTRRSGNTGFQKPNAVNVPKQTEVYDDDYDE